MSSQVAKKQKQAVEPLMVKVGICGGVADVDSWTASETARTGGFERLLASTSGAPQLRSRVAHLACIMQTITTKDYFRPSSNMILVWGVPKCKVKPQLDWTTGKTKPGQRMLAVQFKVRPFCWSPPCSSFLEALQQCSPPCPCTPVIGPRVACTDGG